MNLLDLFTKIRTVKYTHIEESASYAYERVGNTLYIYFEGSNGARDWLNNFNFPATPYKRMEYKWYAHRGFLKVWKAVEPHVKPLICDLSVEQIIIGGYSHGGALAALCHEYCKYNRPDICVSGFGFGSPRVLWGFMRKAVKKRFEGFMVIRNGRDIVTCAPPAWMGYRHVGKLLEIGQFSDYNPIESHIAANYKKELRRFYD